jgi:hypothetical protein
MSSRMRSNGSAATQSSAARPLAVSTIACVSSARPRTSVARVVASPWTIRMRLGRASSAESRRTGSVDPRRMLIDANAGLPRSAATAWDSVPNRPPGPPAARVRRHHAAFSLPRSRRPATEDRGAHLGTRETNLARYRFSAARRIGLRWWGLRPDREADQDVPETRRKVVGATGIEPVTPTMSR